MNEQRLAGATTRILLLRHGETAAPDLFHGSESDIGLGPRGRAQAVAAGESLQVFQPAAVYCSGMRRAVETAEPIAAACGLPLLIEPELRERRMGPLSGFPRVEGMPIYEEAKSRWMAGEVDFTHPGGESFAGIRERVVPAVEAIAERHRGSTVVIVGHGVANRVIMTSLVEGLSPANFDEITIEFVATTRLIRDSTGWKIE
jgi:broad specificity phosphatase PhoE